MMTSLLRIVYRVLCPEKSRNYLGLYRYLYEDGAHPTILTEFTEKKVLVIAPHMDDDVLGCGGTIRHFKKAGSEVTVVYMTDGRRGDPALEKMRLSDEQRQKKEEDLVLHRKEEARRTARCLGIDRLIFLDYPDMTFTCTSASVQRMVYLLQEESPDAVFIPFLTEKHRDHRMTNEIFCNALKQAEFHFICFGYEVWTALLPNCLVNITDVLSEKKEAILQHKSQLAHCDYIRAVTCLNGFRSMVYLEGDNYAEAFYRASPQLYRFLFTRMR